MNEEKVKDELIKLGFTTDNINKIEIFVKELLKYNKKYNLISKSTEKLIWVRHVLDSAQIIKYIAFDSGKSLADLGTGAGLPGLIIAIFNKNSDFHVKLYEKSPVKCIFLNNTINMLKIPCVVVNKNVNDLVIHEDIVVARAFKKTSEIIRISREIISKSHKIIILKGKSAQEDIKNAFIPSYYKYKLENSITNEESKIIIVDVIKK